MDERFGHSHRRTHVKNAVHTVEDLLKEDGEGHTLKSNAKNPFTCELLTGVGHHKRVGAGVAVTLLAIDWDLPLGN